MAVGPRGTVAIVNAFKAQTGSSSVARSYYAALQHLRREVHWYQCVSSRDRDSYDSLGAPIEGYTLFRDDRNLALNSLFVFPRKVGRLKEAVTFLTDPVLLGAAGRLTRPIVIVHDLRELADHRRSVVAGVYFRWLFRGLREVSHVLCDSDATRTELLRFYQPAVPVDVVHPPAGLAGDPAGHIERSLTRMAKGRTLNILCIAADRPYKNLSLVYRLAKQLEAPRGGWRFRFRLISRIGPESRHAMERLNASNLEVVPSVPDAGSAYEEADALLHPSLVEGFGLPPVEAMQFGIPIVAADVACLREVVHTGGTLVDPLAMDRWLSAVTELTDPGVYRERANASADRGRRFTSGAFEERLSSWMRWRLGGET
ncbi:MAG TPA: glycosyltransferase [Thermoplasmata archaeon]|nr:glycosyltransferase [Thermoplasmata archaeon]